jgi:hypothetical protein
VYLAGTAIDTVIYCGNVEKVMKNYTKCDSSKGTYYMYKPISDTTILRFTSQGRELSQDSVKIVAAMYENNQRIDNRIAGDDNKASSSGSFFGNFSWDWLQWIIGALIAILLIILGIGLIRRLYDWATEQHDYRLAERRRLATRDDNERQHMDTIREIERRRLEHSMSLQTNYLDFLVKNPVTAFQNQNQGNSNQNTGNASGISCDLNKGNMKKIKIDAEFFEPKDSKQS